MNNLELFEKVEETSALINRLFWVAGQYNSWEIHDLLDEIQLDDYKAMFPENEHEELEDYYKFANARGFLIDYKHLGFIAECYQPICSNFYLREGTNEPTAWQSSQGSCTSFYLYADDLESLIEKMQAESKVQFQKEVDKAISSGKFKIDPALTITAKSPER